MNHILLFDADFIGTNVAVLRDHRFEHCVRQLKCNIGDELKVGLWNDNQGLAIVSALSAEEITLTTELSQTPPQASPVKLLLAMPRPKVLRRVLRSAIELGVKEIHLINTWKVEKSYWQTPWLSESSLHDINCEALSLAKDTIPAKITIHKRFKPFVEDELALWVSDHNCIIAHPAPQPLTPNVEKPTWLAIGPEGGFTDYEVQKLQDIGFDPQHLGYRILRVENAVSAALGRFV